MKKLILTIAIILSLFFQSFGQVNPIENLTWSAWYEFPNNYFILEWEEPELPHDDLIGYNVYRENELYRFQEETSLYHLEEGSNCEEEFLLFNDSGFFVHVTAVYHPDETESEYTQTIWVEGLALNLEETSVKTPILYPNPTTGILNIDFENLNKIILIDIRGKVISEIEPNSQIDLSSFTKGIYFIKLVTNNKISTKKILIN